MNYKLILGAIVLALIAGYGGYSLKPDVVIEKEKIVEVEKQGLIKDKSVIEQFDPKTGNLLARETRDITQKTQENVRLKDREEIQLKLSKNRSLQYLYGHPLTTSFSPRHQVNYCSRLIGDLWGCVGVDYQAPTSFGGNLGVRLDF